MADPTDMIMPMLREMRSESAAHHADVLARLDKIEAAQVTFRQALTADTLMGKLITGEFDERIEKLEPKMKAMEGRA